MPIIGFIGPQATVKKDEKPKLANADKLQDARINPIQVPCPYTETLPDDRIARCQLIEKHEGQHIMATGNTVTTSGTSADGQVSYSFSVRFGGL